MEYRIRPVTAEDAGALHALRLTPGVMENLLGIPSWRLDQARGWLDGLGSDSHEFAAVTPEGRVVGEAGLSGCSRPRLKHVGSLGMMVHPEFWGQGVGSALMEAMMDVADNYLMLVRVELEVFTDNQRAIRLYERFGFETEGVRRMAAVRQGRYADLQVMARLRPGLGG